MKPLARPAHLWLSLVLAPALLWLAHPGVAAAAPKSCYDLYRQEFAFKSRLIRNGFSLNMSPGTKVCRLGQAWSGGRHYLVWRYEFLDPEETPASPDLHLLIEGRPGVALDDYEVPSLPVALAGQHVLFGRGGRLAIGPDGPPARVRLGGAWVARRPLNPQGRRIYDLWRETLPASASIRRSACVRKAGDGATAYKVGDLHAGGSTYEIWQWEHQDKTRTAGHMTRRLLVGLKHGRYLGFYGAGHRAVRTRGPDVIFDAPAADGNRLHFGPGGPPSQILGPDEYATFSAPTDWC